MEKMLRVGVVTATHGLKGEVKVFPTTEDPSRYDVLERVYVQGREGRECLQIEAVRYFKQYVIVKFKNIDRIEDVQRLVKKDLFITRDQAIPLEEGEYFISDLVGLTVVDDQGNRVGELTDVLATGANDVYVVQDGDEEILIPVIPDCIRKVDLEKQIVLVHMLEGLR